MIKHQIHSFKRPDILGDAYIGLLVLKGTLMDIAFVEVCEPRD